MREYIRRCEHAAFVWTFLCFVCVCVGGLCKKKKEKKAHTRSFMLRIIHINDALFSSSSFFSLFFFFFFFLNIIWYLSKD